MTNLTEQWKKGKLPEGEYWVKYTYGDIERLDYFWKTFSDNGYPINKETIAQVLAPVPSYQELKEERENNEFLLGSRESEIIKLKELLKECESSIQYYQETYGVMDLDTYILLAKLKEVLK